MLEESSVTNRRGLRGVEAGKGVRVAEREWVVVRQRVFNAHSRKRVSGPQPAQELCGSISTACGAAILTKQFWPRVLPCLVLCCAGDWRHL